MDRAKKEVLIDLTNYGNVTCGFGQIAENYAHRFASAEHDKFDLVYLVPKGSKECFGDGVRTVEKTTLTKFLPMTRPRVDLWHAVNQQCKMMPPNSSAKFVYTIHDLNFLTEKSPAKARRYLRRLQRRIDRADAVTAISKYTADLVTEHCDLKGKTVKVIYNGVERVDMLPDSRPTFAGERPFFFTIGQIRRKKNFHLLLDVMAAMPEYDLYISGDTRSAGGVYAEEIRQAIAAKGLKNVFLTGTISDQERIWLYRHCEAFLFPSQGEGFGLPPIEAMQFGKPVFAAARTCLPEICGGHAYLWHDLTTDEMLESIRQNLPAFYADPSKAGAVKAYARTFSYDNHINAYLNLYNELLGV